MNETLLLAALGPLGGFYGIVRGFVVIDRAGIAGGLLVVLGGMTLLGSLLGYETYPKAWLFSLTIGMGLAGSMLLAPWRNAKRQQRG